MNRRDFVAVSAVAGGVAAAEVSAVAARTPRSRAHRMDRENVLTRDGVRLAIRDWGKGEPVLFLSGWCLNSDFWCYQMTELVAQGYRCIAYDRRGHGRSSDPGDGYDYETLTADLADVIEALDLQRLTIVGYSMSSGELAMYLSRYGQARVRKAVFIGATTPFMMKTADNPMGIERALLSSGLEPLKRDFPGWIGENAGPFFTSDTSQDMITWGKGLMLQTSLQAALECARASAETDFRADLEKIRVPTLVIHGDKDASNPLPLTGKRTAALIPGAKLVVYEGAPHGLPLTHTQQLNEDLIRFLRA